MKVRSLKTVLQRDRQRDGSASKFEDIGALLAISFNTMQIRDTFSLNKDESPGRGKNNAGRHDSVLNATARKKRRNYRRNSDRSQERGYRGNEYISNC